MCAHMHLCVRNQSLSLPTYTPQDIHKNMCAAFIIIIIINITTGLIHIKKKRLYMQDIKGMRVKRALMLVKRVP